MTGIIVGGNLGLQGNSGQVLGSNGVIGNPTTGQEGENIYVNAQTGNLVIQRNDEYLSGVGLSVSLQNTYNSLGALANNWTPSVDETIGVVQGGTGVNTASSYVIQTASDGSQLKYTYSTSLGLYVLANGSGAEATLSFSTMTSKWTWTSGDHDTVQTYNSAGLILSEHDNNGNTVTYGYNASNQLTSVKTADGETTYLDYTGSLLTDLRTVYEQNGVATTLTRTYYSYDSSNRLTKVTVDLSPNDNSITDGQTYVTQYGYQGTTDLISSITESDGTNISIGYTGTQVTSFTQTVNGVARKTTFSYNSTTDKTTVTDPLGLVTTLTYNASGQLTNILGPAIAGVSQQQRFTYDATTGNVHTVVDASNNTTTYTYNSTGTLASVQDAKGDTTSYTYGSSNQLLSVKAPLGGTTYYFYDANLNLDFTVSGAGDVTQYIYNAMGQRVTSLVYSQVPDTAVTASTTLATLQAWVAQAITGPVTSGGGGGGGGGGSNVQTQAQPNGVQPDLLAPPTSDVATTPNSVAGIQRTDYTYDFRGNLASTTAYSTLNPDGTGSTSITSQVSKVLYVYNQAGQLLQRMPIQESPTQAETYVYDGLGRVTSYTDLYGNATLTNYSASGYTTTVTMANGLAKTSTYDQAGELTSEIDSSGGTTVAQTTYAYDIDGRLRMATDGLGLTTYYLYDEAGRRVGEIDPNGRLTQTVYTANNLVAETIVYDTPVSSSAINSLSSGGVPTNYVPSTTTALTLANSGVTPTATALDRKTWNFYDTANRLVETVDALGDITTYTYDTDSRVTSTTSYATPLTTAQLATFMVTPTLANATPVANATADRTTVSAYDADNRLVAQTDGEGYVTAYTYTAAGQLASTYKYATRGTVGSTTAPATSTTDISTFNYYDGRGLLSASVDGDGNVTTYSYNEYGNLAQETQGMTLGSLPPTSMVATGPITINFTATATAYNSTWPTVQVYVDGMAFGSAITLNSATANNYSVTSTADEINIGHTVSLVFTNGPATAGAGPSFSISNLSVGKTSLTAGGVMGEFTSTTKGSIAAGTVMTSNTVSVLGTYGWTFTDAQYYEGLATQKTVLQQTNYVYNAYGDLLSTTRYLASGSETDTATYNSAWQQTSYTSVDRTSSTQYNAEGQVTASMGGVGSAALAALGSSPTQSQVSAVWAEYGATYTYDLNGQRIAATDSAGNKTLYYYNTDGQLADTVNAAGEVVAYQYDQFGDLASTTIYAARLSNATLSTLAGGLVNSTLTNAITGIANATLDAVSKATFGNTGLELTTTDALNTQTTDAYNAFGELQTEVTPGATGASTQDNYDRRGLLVSQNVTYSGTTLTTLSVLDAFGRAISMTDANLNTTSVGYDADGNVISRKDGLGQTSSSTYDAFGNVLTNTDARGLVTHYAYTPFERTVTVTSPDGIVVTTTYNAHGQATSIFDGDGDTTTYTYDLDGNLLQTEVVGAAVDLITKSSYDTDDRVSISTDGNGVQTSYSYDAANRLLTQVIDPGSGHLNLTTTYQYNTRSEVTQVTDSAGIITQYSYDLDGQKLYVTVDPAGQNLETQYTYDAEGRITQQVEGYGTANAVTTMFHYDGFGRLNKKVVDPSNLALTTQYTYDNDGNLVAEVDAAGVTTRNVYDADSHLTYTVDGAGDVVANTYDADGNLAATTSYLNPISMTGMAMQIAATTITGLLTTSSSGDETVRYVYDGENRLRYTISALGEVLEHDYDGNGNVVTQIAHANLVSTSSLALVNSVATVQSLLVASSSDEITRMIYDGANRLRYSVDAGGYLTEMDYDADGNVVTQIAYHGVLATPSNWTLTAVQTAISSQNLASDIQNRTTTSVYDANDRLAATVDASNYLTTYSYDGDGRELSSTAYAKAYGGSLPVTLANVQAWTLSGSSQTAGADRTTYIYFDSAGRVTYSVDALGYVTQTVYNAGLNQIAKTIAYPAAITVTASTTTSQVKGLLPSSVPATAIVLQYQYDTAGRQTATIDGNGVETLLKLNGDGQVQYLYQAYGLSDVSTTYNVYDVAGRLSTQTIGYGTSAARTTTWGYDGHGNIVSITNGLGYTTMQTFDLDNRMLTSSVPISSTVAATTLLQYDAFGNKVMVQDPLGNREYFYFNQLNQNILEVDPLGYVTQTTYTAFDKIASVTRYGTAVTGAVVGTPPTIVTNSALDATTTFSYDNFNRLKASTDALSHTEQYTYDAFGDRISFTNQLGAVTNYSYDQRSEQVTQVVNSTNADLSTNQVTTQTQYDAFGNKIKMIEALGLPEQRTTTYTYDLDNRLKTQSGQSLTIWTAAGGTATATPTTSYTYDDRGNQTSVTDANGNITANYYDAANDKIAEVSGAGTFSTWTYDAAGNMLSARVYGDLVTPGLQTTVPTPVNAANYRETDYTYDEANRQISTSVGNVILAQRSPGETALQIYVGEILTATVYDLDGNVIQTCDARGDSTYYYYDADGNKQAELNALNGLTVWTYDTNGNVTQQYQYANTVSLVASTSLTVTAMQQNLTASGSDRITKYVYDLMGRVLSQSLQGVINDTVTGDTVAQTTSASTTQYTYDGLGDVLQETQPDGDITNYQYDTLGREDEVQGAAFLDYTGATVRPTTTLKYNGLGLVVSETQHATTTGTSSNDRTTLFTYGTGGRLTSMAITGTNVATSYSYDANGNVTQQITTQVNASGVSQTDATDTTYDAANRVTNTVVTSEASGATSFTNLDSQQTQYDAYGEVTAQGANGGWQQYMQYDNAGRVWKTNSSDGSSKVYLYDENGNETVLIKSAGANLQPLSLTQIIEISEATTPTDPQVVAAIAAGGTNMTVNVYDALNRLTDSYTPALKSIDDLSALQQFVAESASGQFSDGGILLGSSSLLTKNVTTASPTTQGSVGANATGTVSMSWAWSITANTGNAEPAGPSPDSTAPQTGTENYSVTVTVPKSMSTGGGVWELVSAAGTTTAANNPSSTVTLHVSAPPEGGVTIQTGSVKYPDPFYNGSAILYKKMPDGSLVKVASIPYGSNATQFFAGTSGSGAGSATVAADMEIQNQNAGVDRVLFYYRIGSTGPWSSITMPAMTNSGGGAVSGWYSINPATYGLTTSYQFQYVALNSAGTVINYESGSYTGGASTISQTPQNIGGAGQAFETSDSNFQFTQMGNAQSAIIYYRPHGSSSAWSSFTLGEASIAGIATPGWFQFSSSKISGATDFYIETYSGTSPSGTPLNMVSGTMTPGNGNITLSDWQSNPASSVYFNTPPASSASMILTYAPASNPTATTTIVLPYNAAQGLFSWNTAGIAPNGDENYLYNYSYQIWSTSNQEVDAASGQVQVGLNVQMISHNIVPLSDQIIFDPPETSAEYMILEYGTAGSSQTGYTQITLTKNAIGLYAWDIDTLRPSLGSLALDYTYTLQDSSHKLVMPINASEEQGSVVLEALGSTNHFAVQWDITGLNNNPPAPGVVQAAVHTAQVYDIFGDVIESIDGLGNATNMTYNTMGKMLTKALPQVSVTDLHGNVTSVNPTTAYGYDLSGRLDASTDADGNLTTYINLAGFGDIGGTAKVSVTNNPDTSSTKNLYDIFGDVRKMVDGLGDVTTETYDQADRLITITRPTRASGTPGYSSTGPNADVDTYTYDSHGNRITDTNVYNTVTQTFFDAEDRVTETIDGGGLTTSYAYSTVNVTGVNGAVTTGWKKVTTSLAGLTTTDDTDYFGHLTLHTDFGGHTSTYTFNAAAEVTNESGTSGSNLTYAYYVNGAVESITDNPDNTYQFYEYDADGNEIIATYSTIAKSGTSTVYYQNAEITYDADDRVIEFADIGPDIKYAYDANGNRVEIKAVYTDPTSGATDTQDYWYEYDSMNRYTVSMGTLSGGNIVLGTAGVSLQYDADGQRKEATYGYDGHSEGYTYTTDGYLEETKIAVSGQAISAGTLRAERVNDLLGRVTNYYEYQANGTTVSYDDINQTYDASNRLISDQTNELNASGTGYTTVNESYGYKALNTTTGAYTGTDLGVITNEKQVTTNTNVTVSTAWTYQWWDSAQVLTIKETGVDPNNPNTVYWYPGLSNFSYDVNGHLQQNLGYSGAQVGSTPSRTVNYVEDPYGEILSEDELDGPSSSYTQGPQQHFDYLNGAQIANIGNNPIAGETSYEASLVNPTGGQIISGDFADFDANFNAINAQYASTDPSSYTVANGDTLQDIAQKVWGNSSLWYLIANANGLASSSDLISGETLTIPDKVTSLQNNSSTATVYNPQQAEGNVMPLLPNEPAYPPPPIASHGNNGCAAFGEVLAVVVAVAVVVATGGSGGAAAGWASSLFGVSGATATVAGDAIAGGLADAASQGVSIATGNQKGFSFTQVAEGAIGGAVGGAIQTSGLVPNISASVASSTGSTALGNFVGGALGSVTGSLATAGIEDVLGVPNKFSWNQIGAEALGAGVANVVDPMTPSGLANNKAGNQIVRGLIGGAITAGVSNQPLSASLPSIIGNTIATIGATVEAYQAQAAAAAAAANAPVVDILMKEILPQAGQSPYNSFAPAPTYDLSNLDLTGLGSGTTTSPENVNSPGGPATTVASGDSATPSSPAGAAPQRPPDYIVQAGDNPSKIGGLIYPNLPINAAVGAVYALNAGQIKFDNLGNPILQIGQSLSTLDPNQLTDADISQYGHIGGALTAWNTATTQQFRSEQAQFYSMGTSGGSTSILGSLTSQNMVTSASIPSTIAPVSSDNDFGITTPGDGWGNSAASTPQQISQTVTVQETDAFGDPTGYTHEEVVTTNSGSDIVGQALTHPGDAAIGALKFLGNIGPSLANLYTDGAQAEANADIQSAAAISGQPIPNNLPNQSPLHLQNWEYANQAQAGGAFLTGAGLALWGALETPAVLAESTPSSSASISSTLSIDATKSASAGIGDDLVYVYRGTNRVAENDIYADTGNILSDAAQRSYMETGSLDQAYAASDATHQQWIDIWGSEDQYAQAHGAFGTELSRSFGLDRTFISVTTDPATAASFSDGGMVYGGYVPRSLLINQTLPGAGEGELLLKSGTDLLKPLQGPS